MPTKPSDDAVEWAYRRYVKGDSEQEAYFDELEVQMGIAQQIYDIRKKLGMTREDLAELAGFPAGTVRALEETYYDGDWETAIEKINAALCPKSDRSGGFKVWERTSNRLSGFTKRGERLRVGRQGLICDYPCPPWVAGWGCIF